MQIFAHCLHKISSFFADFFVPVARSFDRISLHTIPTHHTRCKLYISSRTFLALNTPSHQTSTILRFH